MTLPYLKIAAHDVPDSEARIRHMARELAQLTDSYRTITAARFDLGKCDAEAFEAHLELLLPQHQIIVNASSPAPERALHEVVARALDQLALLEQRDPAIRPRPEAKAA
ncbi:MAG TPA: hypothetical protein VEV21_14375 [Burkholderiales bacterium]|nr:hypothetical protein [Burkholderiales bacterium]